MVRGLAHLRAGPFGCRCLASFAMLLLRTPLIKPDGLRRYDRRFALVVHEVAPAFLSQVARIAELVDDQGYEAEITRLGALIRVRSGQYGAQLVASDGAPALRIHADFRPVRLGDPELQGPRRLSRPLRCQAGSSIS